MIEHEDFEDYLEENEEIVKTNDTSSTKELIGISSSESDSSWNFM